jgi:hypothetical protein
MQVTYSQRWNVLTNAPINQLTADQARRRDGAGEWYTAVCGDPAVPDAIIDVVWENDHCGVHFFDGLRREYLHYSVQAPRPRHHVHGHDHPLGISTRSGPDHRRI